MQDTLAKHPSLGSPQEDGTMRKAFTIDAWNEFGVSGMVAPTKGSGTMMFEVIKEDFGDCK